MLTPETTLTETQQHLDCAEERGNILSITNYINEQVDIAIDVKESLEAELSATLKKLSEESIARARLAEQVQTLEAQANQLQKDLFSAKDKSVKFANFVEERLQEAETVPNIELGK